MMLTLQKYRANIREIGGFPDSFLAANWPWVFGEKCPLPTLSRLLDRVERGERLAPGDYYNMMTVLFQFMLEIVPLGVMLGIELPTQPPSIDVFRGWDPEE